MYFTIFPSPIGVGTKELLTVSKNRTVPDPGCTPRRVKTAITDHEPQAGEFDFQTLPPERAIFRAGLFARRPLARSGGWLPPDR
jgi:hypothetical protein